MPPGGNNDNNQNQQNQQNQEVNLNNEQNNLNNAEVNVDNLENKQLNIQEQVDNANKEIAKEQVPPPKGAEDERAKLQEQIKQMQQQMQMMQQTIQLQQTQLMQTQQMQQQREQEELKQNQQQQLMNQQKYQQQQRQLFAQRVQHKDQRQQAHRNTVRNADDIVNKLQADVLTYEKMAKDAKRGKYDKARMPQGMRPKYFYAAVRDYHKDLLKKINALPNDELKKKYYAKYYNQDAMERYVRFRAGDPAYRHMVDNYKSATVLDAYEKLNKARKKPPEFGYPEYKEVSKGVNPAAEYGKITTDNYMYQDGTYYVGTAWDDYRREALEYNRMIDNRRQKGNEEVTQEQIKEKADKLLEKADHVIETYKDDSRSKDFVKEAKDIKAYLEDVKEYGPDAANLRRVCRNKIEAAKDLKAGYENAAEAADSIVAKKLLGNSAQAQKFWNQ
ncbi:MAG: hypothetical protein J5842_02465, partial [Lachnospiraceae bacterium]|nr:hypothetical protein [Lachnospiraceae bacterium]